jgi:membrane protein implicated in regulation of membrane protease activity
MKYIKAFLLFWYDFIVGDDWVIAVGIVLALLGTHQLAHSGINAWWLLPIAVVILLAISLWRLTRSRTRPPT